MYKMEKIAVIDSETNWRDEVMSIGIVVSEMDSFAVLESSYCVISPEYRVGGMFSSELCLESAAIYSRLEALLEIERLLISNKIATIFAYNAAFDYRHLPELRRFDWRDITSAAAYRQYNHKIPREADCYRTGRLKRNYGVEAILKLLSGDLGYRETHNALGDALDELKIMEVLGLGIDVYKKVN